MCVVDWLVYFMFWRLTCLFDGCRCCCCCCYWRCGGVDLIDTHTCIHIAVQTENENYLIIRK